ncbi:MDR family MFS transporter [Tumebacillus permanentifrigoris]|uniref:EmrB/QacA subfamily drug resistance transporter n=1 Tax=Tumebacillus permanentifrigoris TaxID=378543 RepID=A0A316DBJ4_9BACL|nr:MDR family MFS transporter [Tumebacillus permanentifrigoris]PWK14452.1 EmrB/QacA subfamily drug resistance transporter [Tumebacillus permanentifrigoris]
MKETNRKAVLTAVLLANFLAAIDVSIVGTAMPTIIGTLGGLPIMSWVFSAFLLASTVTVPIYGKLSDLYGRKIIFMIGAAFIIIGSILCALSGSMVQLIIFRVVQGLGAGGIMAVATTIIGDIFTVEERGKMQGLLSSVWGISAILGPLLGGLMINFLSWQWVFYINVPVGLIAMAVLFTALHENIERKKHSIDYIGSLTLAVSMTSLLLALLSGGAEYAWVSPQILGLFGVAILFLIWFIFNERRVAEPMISFELFKNPTISVASGANFLIGGVLTGLSSYIPSYVQGVLGDSPTMAGMVLMPLSIGWPIASFIGGSRLTTWGYRRTALIGVGGIAIASVLLNFTTIQLGEWYPMVVLFVMGFGMGLCTMAFIVATQTAVSWNQRGIATASLQFIRSLGSAVGVAIMGAVMNAKIISDLMESGVANPLEASNALLDESRRPHLPADLLDKLVNAFDNGLHYVFILLAVFGVLSFVMTLTFPKKQVQVEEREVKRV